MAIKAKYSKLVAGLSTELFISFRDLRMDTTGTLIYVIDPKLAYLIYKLVCIYILQ